MSAAAARRQSVAAMRRTSMDPHSRTATAVMSAHTGKDLSSKLLENTYKLEPEIHVSTSKLKNILEDCMTSILQDKPYDSQCSTLTKTVADTIKKRAKELGLGRYKFVCLVCIGPRDRGTVNLASRCIWSPEFDTYAEHTYNGKDLYATAVIYGIYME